MEATIVSSKWFEERGHQLLLLTLMLMILVSPFIWQDSSIGWLDSIILVSVLLASAFTVSKRGHYFHVALFLGVPAIFAQIAVFFVNNFWLETLNYIVTTLFLFWICLLLLWDIVLRVRHAGGSLFDNRTQTRRSHWQMKGQGKPVSKWNDWKSCLI